MSQRMPQRFLPLLPLETRLIGAVEATARYELDKVSVCATPASYAIVRGRFLRWLLLEAIPASITELELHKAVIQGELDLCGNRIKLRLGFRQCRFDAAIDVTGATIAGLAFVGGSIPRVLGDRLIVAGSLLISSDVARHAEINVRGAIRLNGAKIGGNLDCTGAQVGGELADRYGRLPTRNLAPVFRKGSSDRPAPTGEATGYGNRGVFSVSRTWISLEADGLTVAGHALFVWPFCAAGELRLDGCKIGRNLDCSGAHLSNVGGYTLSAAGARLDGTLYLGSPFHERHTRANPQFVSRGTVRIDGAQIDGDLDCSDGQFLATATESGWRPDEGTYNDVYALKANGIQVGADARLAGRFISRGNVTLINATVGRDFDCSGARFDFAGGEALCCDGIDVAGVVLLQGALDEPGRFLWTNGVLRFALARVQQDLYVRGVTFDRSTPAAALLKAAAYSRFRAPEALYIKGRGGDGSACGIYAEDAKIAGRFMWKSVRCTPVAASAHYPFWLHISGSRADAVDDELASWRLLDRFDITNCQYRTIDGLFHEKRRGSGTIDEYVTERLDLLDREYAPRSARGVHQPLTAEEVMDRFKPQPYLQFARALRAAGLDAAADKVVIRLECNRTRYSGFSLLYRATRWLFLERLLLYGYGWARPAIVLLAWALLSSVVFELAYSQHRIIPAWHNRRDLTGSAETTPPHIAFNAVVFALDTLIPLVDLNQKDNWEIEPLSDHMDQQARDPISWYDFATYRTLWLTTPDRIAAILIIYNKFFGWLLTTLFAGGISGVLRGGKEPAGATEGAPQ